MFTDYLYRKHRISYFSFIDDAFETFGGVPEELLTDNMKTVMDQPRTAYSKGKVNPRFAQFASDYGFKVRPCMAARLRQKQKWKLR